MQCNTNYTASDDNFRHINLRVLNTYKVMFPDCVLGLSDHTFGHATVLGALALGAKIFEKHFTDDNARTGPDHRFSMNPATWRDMVTAARQLEQAMGDGVKRIEDNEADSADGAAPGAVPDARHAGRRNVTEAEDQGRAPHPRRRRSPHTAIGDVLGKALKRDVQADSYPALGGFAMIAGKLVEPRRRWSGRIWNRSGFGETTPISGNTSGSTARSATICSSSGTSRRCWATPAR